MLSDLGKEEKRLGGREGGEYRGGETPTIKIWKDLLKIKKAHVRLEYDQVMEETQEKKMSPYLKMSTILLFYIIHTPLVKHCKL